MIIFYTLSLEAYKWVSIKSWGVSLIKPYLNI
jgi:hypothetical protein